MANKVTPIKAKIPAPAERRKVVDEFAALHEQLGPMRKRHDALKKELERLNPQLGKSATATAREEGDKYVVDFSVREDQTKVTGLDKLFKLLGLKQFLAFVKRCQVTQKALDASLPDKSQRGLFLVTTQTGSRNISITKKFGEAA